MTEKEKTLALPEPDPDLQPPQIPKQPQPQQPQEEADILGRYLKDLTEKLEKQDEINKALITQTQDLAAQNKALITEITNIKAGIDQNFTEIDGNFKKIAQVITQPQQQTQIAPQQQPKGIVEQLIEGAMEALKGGAANVVQGTAQLTPFQKMVLDTAEKQSLVYAKMGLAVALKQAKDVGVVIDTAEHLTV